MILQLINGNLLKIELIFKKSNFYSIFIKILVNHHQIMQVASKVAIN